jgi:hypothetical protein
MSAAFAGDAERPPVQAWQTHSASRASGVAQYIAALLGGFGIGAGLAVLLWHLF